MYKYNNKIFSGFTLVEVMVVVVIAGILLAITFNLGWDYINFLKYKQDRESLTNMLNEIVTMTKTTNYLDNQKYSYIDMAIAEDGISYTYSTGDALNSSTCTPTVSEAIYREHILKNATISGYTGVVRLVPFQLACSTDISFEGDIVGNTNTCANTTGISFDIESSITDHITCYHFDLSVCKFTQVLCP